MILGHYGLCLLAFYLSPYPTFGIYWAVATCSVAKSRYGRTHSVIAEIFASSRGSWAKCDALYPCFADSTSLRGFAGPSLASDYLMASDSCKCTGSNWRARCKGENWEARAIDSTSGNCTIRSSLAPFSGEGDLRPAKTSNCFRCCPKRKCTRPAGVGRYRYVILCSCWCQPRYRDTYNISMKLIVYYIGNINPMNHEQNLLTCMFNVNSLTIFEIDTFNINFIEY